MKLRSRLLKWHQDGTGVWVSFRVDSSAIAVRLTEEMKDIFFDVEIKAYKGKRSLDANAYCWTLLDKLAAVMRIGKVELYRSFVCDIGGNSQTVCVVNKGVEGLRKHWESRGLGWVTETMKSKIEGCTNVILYYGSSTYDTAQMSRLIQLVVEECQAQGIETMAPDELWKLKGLTDG